MPGLAGADRQSDREVGFAGAGWAEEHHVLPGGDEVQGAQVGDEVAFEAAGVVEVELLQRFAGGEPGGPDAALTAVAFPGGHLPLQAGDQELLVRPGLGSGPFGQPGHRVPQRRRLQRPGQVGDLGGRSLGPVVVRAAAITPPRRRRHPGPARCRSRSGRGPAPRVRASDAPLGPLPAQRDRRRDVPGIGDRLVPCPDPLVLGDRRALADAADRVQVGDHLDPAADHRGVHRVVVAVDADVVVPRQPQRGAPPGRRRRPAAAPASPAGPRRSGRWPRSPTPAVVARSPGSATAAAGC